MSEIVLSAVDSPTAPLLLPPGGLDATAGMDSTMILILAQVAILTLFTMGAIAMSVCEEKKEDVLTPLRRRIQELEDELEDLRSHSTALTASVRAQKEEHQELERAFLAATEVAAKERMEQKERLEALGRTTDSLVLRCASAAQTSQLESAIARVESKIPRPPRMLSISLDDLPIHWQQRRPFRTNGPVQWKSLTSPRLVLQWALLPDGVPASPVPEQFKMNETISTNRVDRLIPGGQRAILLKAEIWHSTPGLPGDLDCTRSFVSFFDS